MKEEKAKLRQQSLASRRSLRQEEIHQKSEIIWQNLSRLPLFKKAGVVLFYIALPDEVQTQKMMDSALKMGKRIAVPVIERHGREIKPFEIKSACLDLVPGPFGIMQPMEKDRIPLSLEEIDLVIVPGIAFDEQGERLGFGAGFYDRFLRNLPSYTRFVALAFECQLVKKIPCQDHDVPMHYIVTEKRVILCHNEMTGIRKEGDSVP